MTTSFRAGSKQPARPEGWAKEGREWRCLNCRRQAVIGEVTEAGGDKAAQRRALIEFELERDPEASDRDVAKRAKCQAAMVGPVRAALRKAGRLSAAGKA